MFWQLGHVMGPSVRRGGNQALNGVLPGMERDTNERGGRGAPPDLGGDDEEFATVEDVGPEPGETPSVDDV